MPLNDQEKRCIDLVLPVLGGLYGGLWALPAGPTLDELYPNEASPECIVTNGEVNAAIEVKRLTGDEVMRSYKEALEALPRALDPACDGFFVLGPANAFRVPVDRPMLKHLRREVARVAPTLGRGETGGLRLPRAAWVALEFEQGPGNVHCCHNYTGHLFEGLSPLITGSFLLVDAHLPDHNFVTAEALSAFRRELAAACYRRVNGGSNHFEWDEEIPLLRCDEEGDDEHGLDVIAITDARHVDSAVAEALDYVLERAVRKFDRPGRWAERQIIVLDREDVSCSLERVTRALSWLTPADLSNIDLVLLGDGDQVSIVWQKE